MAFNGSGLFVRVYNWIVDRDAGVKIRADRMDTEMDGFATGLSTCVTKDGQTTTTARVPFSLGLGLGDGTVSAPAANFTADTNTGIYRIGADNIGIAANGAKVVDISTSGAAVTGLASGTTVRAGQATSLGSNGTVLQASSNTTALPDTTNSAAEEWVFHVGMRDSLPGGMGISTFGSFSMYDMRRANGTAASPTPLLSGDLIGVIGALGKIPTGYSGGAAQHRFYATENWSNTAQGSAHAFLTVPNGSATFGGEAERVRIDHNGNVGVGTNNPQALMHLNSNTTQNVAAQTGTVLQLSAADSASSYIQINSFGAANNQFSSVLLRQAANTAASPSAVQSGALIGTIGAQAYTSGGAYTVTNSRIQFVTAEAQTASNQGQRVEIVTTPNGSTSAAISATFLGNGNLETLGAVTPASSDGAALGSTAKQWSDLFIAEGGVINWDNGDVTITQANNVLSFAGASTRYEFDANITPSTSDGAALGTTALMFSDAFLASGAVLNFNNGNYTVTHSAGALTFSGNMIAAVGKGLFVSGTTGAGFGGNHGVAVAADGSLGMSVTIGLVEYRDETVGGTALVIIGDAVSILYQSGTNFVTADPGSGGNKIYIPANGNAVNRYGATHTISYVTMANRNLVLV